MIKINIKNIFNSRKKTKNIDNSSVWPTHYLRDWKIIVLGFALGLLFLSIFSWQIYLSNQIAGGYLVPTEVVKNTSVTTINQKRLDAQILLLETRQADYLKLKANKLKLVDPSL